MSINRFKQPILTITLVLAGVLIGRFMTVRDLRGQDTSAAGKVITAESFRLVDKQGKLRAELGISDDGRAGLGLLDKEGKVRLKVILTDTGTPSVGYYTKDGQIYASCSCLWK